MSRILTIVFSLLLIAHVSLAQDKSATEQPAKKVLTGLKAGINLSSLSGDVPDKATQVGANGGIYFLYMESQYFGIQPEIQYSLQGVGVGSDHLLMHYAVVPLMFKVFPNRVIGIQAGPYAGFLLSSKVETDSYRKQYIGKGQDFGFAYGLSFGNEEKVTLSARHHVGLSNLSLESEKVKTQAFQISLGVCISKK